MRHRTNVYAAAVLLLSSVIASPAPAADDGYAVKFARPSKVGDRFHVDAVGAIRTKAVIRTGTADPVTRDEAYGVSLDGTVTVLAVNAQGAETKMSLALDTCTAAIGAKQVPLFPAGTVVTAEWDKEKSETRYAVGGKPVGDDEAEVLGLVFNASDPDGAPDDDIYGSKAAKRVGDVWPINAAAAAKELERIGLKAKEEHIWGECTLAEAPKAEDGDPVLKVRTTFKVRSMSGTGRRPESKMSVRAGSMTLTSTLTLPVDPAKPPLRDETKVTINTELAGKDDDGKPVTANRTVERASERTIKALPAK